MAKLLLDRLADVTDTRHLHLGQNKKLVPRLFAVCTRLVAKTFPDLRMYRINQDLSHLPSFIEK